MRRLIRVVAGRTYHIVGNLISRLIFVFVYCRATLLLFCRSLCVPLFSIFLLFFFLFFRCPRNAVSSALVLLAWLVSNIVLKLTSNLRVSKKTRISVDCGTTTTKRRMVSRVCTSRAESTRVRRWHVSVTFLYQKNFPTSCTTRISRDILTCMLIGSSYENILSSRFVKILCCPLIIYVQYILVIYGKNKQQKRNNMNNINDAKAKKEINRG